MILEDISHLRRLYRIIQLITVKKQWANGLAHTNSIESFWAIFKRGIKGQFHFVSPKYLSNYLDEFSFRFNNKDESDIFGKLILKSVR